jgi:hypothetical protein
MSDSLSSLPSNGNGGGERGWGQVRRHVVKHDWRSIRDALFVGRNEHMSDVDDFVSPLFSRWLWRTERGVEDGRS